MAFENNTKIKSAKPLPILPFITFVEHRFVKKPVLHT